MFYNLVNISSVVKVLITELDFHNFYYHASYKHM